MGRLDLWPRRQAERKLTQLGGSLGRTSSECDSSRLLERRRDTGIRILRTQGKMTCALLDIDHDRGQPTMDLPPVVAVGLRIHRRTTGG
jgi:hypothetical protein